MAFIARGALLDRRLRHLLDRERAAHTALAEREAELARLNAQLVEDSRRDPLTGMRNRRALADDLLELDARRQDGGERFAIALCDVDHFKAYNDHLGHLAGDHALRTISAIVRATLRTGDLSYRFGGEELLLILSGASPAEAVAAAERVRTAVERMALPHADGVGAIMTVSIGVAGGDAMTPTACSRVPTSPCTKPRRPAATGLSPPPPESFPPAPSAATASRPPTIRSRAICAAC